MNVVDSSGWLEYFANGRNADFFAGAIEDTEQLLVPVVSLYEVFKRVLQQSGLAAAQTAVADMHSGQIVGLDEALALRAANLSLELKLPMADSMILATARDNNAVLWTDDAHFRGLENVQFHPKTDG